MRPQKNREKKKTHNQSNRNDQVNLVSTRGKYKNPEYSRNTLFPSIQTWNRCAWISNDKTPIPSHSYTRLYVRLQDTRHRTHIIPSCCLVSPMALTLNQFLTGVYNSFFTILPSSLISVPSTTTSTSASSPPFPPSPSPPFPFTRSPFGANLFLTASIILPNQ